MHTYLTLRDRVKIEVYLHERHTPSEIACFLGKNPSTIYRELRRGMYTRLNSDYTTRQCYSCDKAQARAEFEQAGKGAPIKLRNDYAFCAYILDQIKVQKNSPAVALANITRYHLSFSTKVTLRTLYTYIEKGYIPGLSIKDLPNKGERKKKQTEKEKAEGKTKQLQTKRSIEERPKTVLTRMEFGHWELDSIIGKKEKGATVLSFIERKTRMLLVCRTESKKAIEVKTFLDRLERKFGKSFSRIFKSITVDNGTEFSDTVAMERSIFKSSKGIPRTTVYYCHPYCSSERGTNENHNRMIRRFVPKGTRIERYSPQYLRDITFHIDNYPRKILGWKTPAELFESELIKLGIKLPKNLF